MESLIKPIPLGNQPLALEDKSGNKTASLKRPAPSAGGCRIEGFVRVKKVNEIYLLTWGLVQPWSIRQICVCGYEALTSLMCHWSSLVEPLCPISCRYLQDIVFMTSHHALRHWPIFCNLDLAGSWQPHCFCSFWITFIWCIKDEHVACHLSFFIWQENFAQGNEWCEEDHTISWCKPW